MNMKHLIYFSIATMLVACNDDEPKKAVEEVTPVDNIIEITTPMILADEDYQGGLASYYYDWNGSYSKESNNSLSIKSDGTLVHTSSNNKGVISYYETGAEQDYISDPKIPSTLDLAVIGDKVYLAAVSPVSETDRKLYVYELVERSFNVIDSIAVDLGITTVSLHATEGINGELLINTLAPFAGIRYAHRLKNRKLQELMRYEGMTLGMVVFPFKGSYMEYTGSKLNRLDDQGNATTIIDKYDLDLPRSLEWHYMYFSEDLIFIDLKELVNNERSYALVYDGKDLMKIEAPLFYSSGGYPIHTPFNDGNKYLHYDPATKLLDVYFRGSTMILFKTYDRVYKYQMTLAN